ncbi:riboflavin synthase [bacterium]|jgi:riboflavin synthase|nr:riboflavin synthase [bacterium]
MFSGIIRNLVEIRNLKSNGDYFELEIANPSLHNINNGDSILINGVCLTVVSFTNDFIKFDLLKETIDITNLSDCFQKKVPLNLETSLKFGDENHGSEVTGHVDTVVKFLGNQGEKYFFENNSSVEPYLQEKNYVVLNGVCLTIVDVSKDKFSVCLIPETLNLTNLSLLNIGDGVNLEFDKTARIIVGFLKKYLNKN